MPSARSNSRAVRCPAIGVATASGNSAPALASDRAVLDPRLPDDEPPLTIARWRKRSMP